MESEVRGAIGQQFSRLRDGVREGVDAGRQAELFTRFYEAVRATPIVTHMRFRGETIALRITLRADQGPLNCTS